MALQIAGLTGAEIRNIPYPTNQRGFETGDFYADISLAERELGWKPAASFKEGLEKTVAYYKKNLNKYT